MTTAHPADPTQTPPHTPHAGSTQGRPDLSTPFHSWLGLWREEFERMAQTLDVYAEHSAREMRRNLHESQRLMSAQIDMGRQASAIWVDTARRFLELGKL